MKVKFEGNIVYDKTNNSYKVTIPYAIAQMMKLEAKDKVSVTIDKQ